MLKVRKRVIFLSQTMLLHKVCVLCLNIAFVICVRHLAFLSLQTKDLKTENANIKELKKFRI